MPGYATGHVVRVGIGISAFELGVQGDIIPVTPLRCVLAHPTSSDPALFDDLANEPEDNVGLFLGATFSFLFVE